MNCEHYINFCKTFEVFLHTETTRPEAISHFGQKGDTFYQQMMYAMTHGKIFEVSKSTQKLLALSVTPNLNDALNMPFKVMFLDVAFTREELADLGVEIKAKKICGILASESDLVSQNGDVVGKGLRLVILSEQENGDVWFDVFLRNFNITDAELKESGVRIEENPETDVKARDFTRKFAINFINFLNNPEVEYVERHRDAHTDEKRRKKGKVPIPSSYVINVYGKLKYYMDAVTSNPNFHYNYRFWVRGHFRNLVANKYKEKKRIWICPYIKGDGILIDKRYMVKKMEVESQGEAQKAQL